LPFAYATQINLRPFSKAQHGTAGGQLALISRPTGHDALNAVVPFNWRGRSALTQPNFSPWSI